MPLGSAHPRSRGEHFQKGGRSLVVVSGSSPLARGTPRSLFLLLVVIRLIPARAGNTPDAFLTVTRCAAHPRSRGEHTCVGCGSRRGCGSSPLARGTRACIGLIPVRGRLIPARAGNTTRPVTITSVTSAHPRSRGEHGLGVFGGAHYFISAHPRSRGEHVKAPKAFVKITGSSPLARGTLLCGVRRHASARLIPARAGNTPHARPRRYPSSAHPRSRGEHATATVHDLCLSGSSPLARGTHEPFPPSFFPPRLIPARAGNTMPTILG